MQLSEHLSLAELTRSESAKKHGISNMPNDAQLASLKLLAENIFEPIRNNFRCPILISSGFRSAELNAKIGGANSSQHSLGQAIDIDMDGTSYGVTNVDIFNFIKDKLPFDQLINEFNYSWVHVSYSSRHRREILDAIKVNGVTKYNIH